MLTIIKILLTRYKGFAAAWRQRLERVLFCFTKAAVKTPGATKDPGNENLLHMSRLLDSVATGMISLDGEGRIRVFNAAAEALFSLPRAIVLGVPFREAGRILSFGAHAHRALWERLSDAVWAAGAARDLEFDLTPRNGPRRVISYSVYTLGRPTWSIDKGVVIMFEDITRKKEMEDQISDARKRLQAVFDGITDGIQVIDGEFRITAVNKSMTALLGRTILAGEHCFKTCGFGVKLCDDCPAMTTFETGLPAFIAKRLSSTRSIDADTGERVVEVSTFPLLDRGNRVVQVVEYIKDVTDRVRLAESLEHSRRLAELGEMAAQRVIGLRALRDQLGAHAVQHGEALLLERLDGHEAHARTRRRLANRLGIERIRLAALQVGLHIRGRHQPRLVPETLDLARPVVGRATGLHADEAGPVRGRELFEERDHLTAAQTAPQDDVPRRIGRVHLKHVLRQIKTNRANLRHGRPSRS